MITFTLRLVSVFATILFVGAQPAYATQKPTPRGGGSNGNSNNGNTFDCSRNSRLCTGNSGNGVGNTGPGNQGNDGSNGNAGGGKNGGHSNGGSNNGGHSNGGHSNGGNNNGGGKNGGHSNGGNNNGGHSNGGNNNGGNTDGGSTNGGSTNGGSTNGGSTNGGSTNGGSTNGGSTNGGSTNGGNTDGGSTNGGNADGGSTNGGNADGGSTNGGNADGGSTNGGNADGGSTNGGNADGGNADGGDDGSVDPEPEPVRDEPSRSLRARIEPLFYIDYDFGSGIVAVEDAVEPKNGEAAHLQMTHKAPLYQKTSFELLEGGAGAALSFYFKNATGTLSRFWAQVGLMPMRGTEVSSVRYFKTLAAAKNAKGYTKAPLDVTITYKWEIGDSVTYKSKGGTIFVAGAGVGLAGLNHTSLAQGTWETFVEKVDKTKVYVKITNTQLDAYATGSGAALVAGARTSFNNADDGFSYLIDLSTEDGRKVYSDLVRGNVAAAQKYASEIQLSPELPAVIKIENFKRVSKGKGYSLFLGIPIFLNAVNSENKIESYEKSDLVFDNSSVDAIIGIYDFTTKTRAFGTHTTVSKGFYGVRYNVTDLKTKESLENSEFGRFTWMYQDDNSSMRSLYSNLNQLIQETGLQQLKIQLPNRAADMDFTNLTLNITLNEKNIQTMMASSVGRNANSMKNWAQKRVDHAYRTYGNSLCKTLSESEACESEIRSQTMYSSSKMQAALRKMGSNTRNSKTYTKAFAEFGQAAMANQLTLAMAISMAGEGVEVSFVAEGTYFKTRQLHLRTVGTESRLETRDPKDTTVDSSLNPVYKRSRFHGVITNRNLIGLGAP